MDEEKVCLKEETGSTCQNSTEIANGERLSSLEMNVTLKVDKLTWNYMKKSSQYSSDLSDVLLGLQMITADNCDLAYEVMFGGNSLDKVKQAKQKTEILIEKCESQLKKIVLPPQEQEVYTRVRSFLEGNDLHNGCLITFGSEKTIYLTGKAKEVEQSQGWLEETFGATVTTDSRANGDSVDSDLQKTKDVALDSPEEHLVVSTSPKMKASLASYSHVNKVSSDSQNNNSVASDLQENKDLDASDSQENKDSVSSSSQEKKDSISSESKEYKDYNASESQENKDSVASDSQGKKDASESQENEDPISSDSQVKKDYNASESQENKDSDTSKSQENKESVASDSQGKNACNASESQKNKDSNASKSQENKESLASDSQGKKDYIASESQENKDSDASKSQENKEFVASDSQEKKDYNASKSQENKESVASDSQEKIDYNASVSQENKDSDVSKSQENKNSIASDSQNSKRSLKLSDKNEQQNEDYVELYEPKNEFIELEHNSLIIDFLIWCYMEKHPDYTEPVKRIKEQSDISILHVETAASDACCSRIRIVCTDLNETNICASMYEARSIVEKCQAENVKTVKVPCLDNAVHKRIAKILNHINRLPCYVSLELDMILITGRELEIENCLERLKNYGLTYEILPKQQQQFLPPDDDNHDADIPKEEFEEYHELPVPIDCLLWLFIERRCQQQLAELNRDYNLEITADARETDIVNITLKSNCSDMLDCGKDALIHMIEDLRERITVGCLEMDHHINIEAGLQGTLQQSLNNMETIVVVKDTKILIIGPNQEAMQSQQTVTALLQHLVSQRGVPSSQSFAATEQLENHRFTQKEYNPREANETLEPNYPGGVETQQQNPESKKNDVKVTFNEPDSEPSTITMSSGEANGQGADPPCGEFKELVTQRETDQRQTIKYGGSNSTTASKLSNTTAAGMYSEQRKGAVQTELEQLASKCSICHNHGSTVDQCQATCNHHYCLSCVRQYFADHECPVCGFHKDSSSKPVVTQPANGIMLTTYDNSFRLPGYEHNSRGTVIVTYAFPSGIQTKDLSNPGYSYSALTATAFFPMCREGSVVVDLLQKAFEKRLVFKISQTSDESIGKLVWNGILHKVNIFGGPQQCGYPDSIYLHRVCKELAAKGIHDSE